MKLLPLIFVVINILYWSFVAAYNSPDLDTRAKIITWFSGGMALFGIVCFGLIAGL